MEERHQSLPRDHVGLALSGGGIRSATFKLGVHQALTKASLLHTFDYVSTVSGRRHIGASGVGGGAAAWMAPTPVCGADAPEAPEIRHLRQFTDLLTPRVVLLTADNKRLLVARQVRNPNGHP